MKGLLTFSLGFPLRQRLFTFFADLRETSKVCFRLVGLALLVKLYSYKQNQ